MRKTIEYNLIAEELSAEPTVAKEADAYSGEFDLTPELQALMEAFNVTDDVEILGETAKLKPEVAAELASTYDTFASSEALNERIDGVEKGLKQTVEEMLKKLAPNFPATVTHCSHRTTNYGNPASYFQVTMDDPSGTEYDMDLLYYTYEAGLNLRESASSWNWAFWLGHPDSPHYDDVFVDSYDSDYESIAAEEMLGTWNESQDKLDVEATIKKMVEAYRPEFTFVVDMDERGVFKCHVDNEKGESVWEASSEENEDGSFWPVEDGFMRHSTDIAGLEAYLKNMGTMPQNADLVKG